MFNSAYIKEQRKKNNDGPEDTARDEMR